MKDCNSFVRDFLSCTGEASILWFDGIAGALSGAERVNLGLMGLGKEWNLCLTPVISKKWGLDRSNGCSLHFV